MNTVAQTNEETAALALLKSTKLSLLEAAQVACAAVRAGRGRVKRALRCIAAGEEELKRQERTVTFDKAVEAALEARQHRRSRTLCDFRYVTRRFMKRCPGLARRRVRSITAAECAAYIEAAFETPRQRQKARLTLSGVFSTAMKRGWCSENPVARVEAPRVVEKPIHPLTPEEVERLQAAARQPEFRNMRFSLQLMLYSGVRPTEVERIRPEDICRREKQLIIRPRTSKTGGGRVVTLRRTERLREEDFTIPRDWQRKWRALRRAAGFRDWVPDVCRHTFATYHAAHFRDLPALQLEMGHRDANLLRTRYTMPALRSVARRYWS